MVAACGIKNTPDVNCLNFNHDKLPVWKHLDQFVFCARRLSRSALWGDNYQCQNLSPSILYATIRCYIFDFYCFKYRTMVKQWFLLHWFQSSLQIRADFKKIIVVSSQHCTTVLHRQRLWKPPLAWVHACIMGASQQDLINVSIRLVLHKNKQKLNHSFRNLWI